MDATWNRLKTIQHGDSGHTRWKWIQLAKKRNKAATCEQGCPLRVDYLVECTTLYLKEFLVGVYPYWVNQSEKMKNDYSRRARSSLHLPTFFPSSGCSIANCPISSSLSTLHAITPSLSTRENAYSVT